MTKVKIKKVLLIILAAAFLIVSVIALRIWRLYVSVDDFHAFWAAQAEKQPAGDSLWYVALGDSAAVGIGASSPTKGYVGLIADKLRETSGRPVHVVNIARSGARLADVLETQLPKLKQLNFPEDTVITIDIGSNNMKEFNHDNFKSEFDDILKKLPPRTIIADIPYFGPYSHRHGSQNVSQANEVIHELSQTHGFRLAELYGHTQKNKNIRYYAADLFHPSDKGYRSWFNAFYEVLEARNQ